MYQSIPSLTITPGDPRGFARSHCLGGLGVEILNQRNFLQFSKTSAGTSRLFQRNLRQLEKQVFLCCFMPTFAKTVHVYCIFDNIDHFGHLDHFDKIFRSSNSHFCECYKKELAIS